MTNNAGIAVVYAGGALRGPALIGMSEALDKRNVQVQHRIGISVGSLVAAFASNGYDADEQATIFVKEGSVRPGHEFCWTAHTSTSGSSEKRGLSKHFRWTGAGNTRWTDSSSTVRRLNQGIKQSM